MADGGGDETRSYDLHAISKLIGEPEKINSHFSFFFSNSNDDVNQGLSMGIWMRGGKNHLLQQ
ncbi:hypothetical protein Lalb_Chr02g0155691 [Lupinus albus]|uniref:Uncharacterized protein n=1 Tax=Lupinus albus TaxID=3870 RepID=A0A6A4QZ45_LUPAL|nr:hypothetical protein Lalb_Chr02g0155691 [Lupinus albus]